MASHGRWNHQGPVLPVTTPSFMTIVLAQALEDGKLEIPRSVVRQYGDILAETILLKVSKNANWVMELTKSNGKIWLQKGWPEFARHYSLVHGSLLLFSSKGDYSCFRVQIFKRNTLEINYPPLEINYTQTSSTSVEMNHASNSSHDDSADTNTVDDDPDTDDENDDNDDADADTNDGDAESGEFLELVD